LEQALYGRSHTPSYDTFSRIAITTIAVVTATEATEGVHFAILRR